MSTSVAGKEVRVVHGTQAPSTTTQTRGMERRPGIDGNTAGAPKRNNDYHGIHFNDVGPLAPELEYVATRLPEAYARVDAVSMVQGSPIMLGDIE